MQRAVLWDKDEKSAKDENNEQKTKNNNHKKIEVKNTILSPSYRYMQTH